MRKVLIIGIIILIVVIGMFFLLNRGPMVLYDKEKILQNEKNFTEIAKAYYNDYKSLDANMECSYIDPSGSDNDARCVTSPYEHDFKFSDELYNIHQIVDENYNVDNEKLEVVVVYDNFVVFGNVKGRASLVYSINGDKPRYVMGEKKHPDYDSFSVEKITGNWYYACYDGLGVIVN